MSLLELAVLPTAAQLVLQVRLLHGAIDVKLPHLMLQGFARLRRCEGQHPCQLVHSAICWQLGPPVSAQLHTHRRVHPVAAPICRSQNQPWLSLPFAGNNELYTSGAHAHAHAPLCRYINDTAVDPMLPACAADAMPNLDLSQLEGAGTLQAHTHQRSPGALVAGMASLGCFVQWRWLATPGG
jgi:hypothetical protein